MKILIGGRAAIRKPLVPDNIKIMAICPSDLLDQVGRLERLKVPAASKVGRMGSRERGGSNGRGIVRNRHLNPFRVGTSNDTIAPRCRAEQQAGRTRYSSGREEGEGCATALPKSLAL